MIEHMLLTNKQVIKSEIIGENVINLLDKTFQIPESFDYNVIVVDGEFIARMDLVSKRIYGSDKYTDLLCKLNGISNPFELNEGTPIVVPELTELPKFYYTEKNYEIDPAINAEIRKPIPKGKKEKRKPNEAVIGEKRFKIDKTRKVVIY